MITNLQPKRPGTRSLSNNMEQKKLFDSPNAQQRRHKSTEAEVLVEPNEDKELGAGRENDTAKKQEDK